MNQWDPAQYDANHSFVSDHGMDVLELLSPERDERILDLGCGTGRLTSQLADLSPTVVGLDRSNTMVAGARENYPALSFVCGDARALPFEERTFDAVFSNAVLHWVDDQEMMLSSVRDVLRPGGRFVAEFGGHGNVSAIVDALEQALADRGHEVTSPWHFPRIGEYASALDSHGFLVTYAQLLDRPTRLDDGEAGLRNWIEMFGDTFLDPLSPNAVEDVIDDVEMALKDDLFRDGSWYADYTRLRFVAHLRPS